MSLERVHLRLAPNFIKPETIKNLTYNEQAELLRQIRERRLLIVAQHLQLVEAKKKAKTEKLLIKIERVAKKITNKLEKIDKLFEEVEAELNGARALRLEADMEDE